MNPFLVGFLILVAALGVLLLLGGLERVGTISELGRWHPASLAAVTGILVACLASILVVAPIFLSFLLGGLALLALHYRGEGRWLELGLLLGCCGLTLAGLWGVLIAMTAAGSLDPLPGLIVPVFFGSGVLIMTLGIATLILRPGKPKGEL